MPLGPLHELVAASHSPFHEDGSLAPEAVMPQAAFPAANGIRTVFITGSTGECHSLTIAPSYYKPATLGRESQQSRQEG